MLTPIICIGGPTGAGKSAAACFLAEQLGGEVINADSRQVYADFPIITAQPKAEELAVCRHRLYGFLPSESKISAGEYLRLAGREIDLLRAEGKIPILVGGTGLYFRALLGGIAQIPPVDEAIREYWQRRYVAEGGQALHTVLRDLDPEYAAKIHPNDRQRVTRALEVCESTGKNFTWWHREKTDATGYTALYLGVCLSLSELEPLLAGRIDQMLQAGALDEAAKARKNCDDAAAPGWSGIGCAEVYRYLRGELSLPDCRELWLHNTRAYAKRQLTWFGAEKNFLPHRPGQDKAMLALARDWIDSITK
ncbi:MAG: tRNA (adenosine(37)-N6)-dimethylallyltransferase MiaA [Deltaproteobacteria bacterium]|jgi:tRNA dimethylallyltransferase|nr:tRNA (adenosine(37)-N6)-dimethylallyltransferase MiaA [Deltaproteobacteria bacterium]